MIEFAGIRVLVPLAAMLLPPALAHGDPPSPAPAFALRGDNVRLILRDAARLQVRLRPDLAYEVQSRTGRDFPSPLYAARVAAAPRFARQKSAALDCSYLYCTEYDSAGRALRAVTREDFFSGTAPPIESPIPTCQSGNDLLPTWQRFENCGGDRQRRNTRK
jgi:hypothetical protein